MVGFEFDLVLTDRRALNWIREWIVSSVGHRLAIVARHIVDADVGGILLAGVET